MWGRLLESFIAVLSIAAIIFVPYWFGMLILPEETSRGRAYDGLDFWLCGLFSTVVLVGAIALIYNWIDWVRNG